MTRARSARAPAAGPPPRTHEDWARAVAEVVRAIPKGEVLSYSQVALRAGMPGNPRGVVKALKLVRGVPWWRVIRADGTVAPQMADSQLSRLAREGHAIRGRRVKGTKTGARASSDPRTPRTRRGHSKA